MRIDPRPARGRETDRPRRPAAFQLRPAVCALEPRQLLSVAVPFQPTADEQYILTLINQVRANPAAAAETFVARAQSDPVLRLATADEDLNAFARTLAGYAPEPPLAFNTRLIEAARDHDAAMLAANSQFHAPSGYLTDPAVARAADGQAYYPTGTNWWATGENIFAYSSAVGSTSTRAVDEYFNAAFLLDWGNPEFGHLKNLLAPGPGTSNPATGGATYPFSEIGIGLLTGVTPTVPPGSNPSFAANAGLNVGPDLVTEEFGWRSGPALLTGVVYQDNAGATAYLPGEGLGAVVIEAVGREGEGTFRVTTWDSGGYSLALPPGTYNVSAGGPGVATPTAVVAIGQNNVAWDVRVPPSPGGVAVGVGAVAAAQAGTVPVTGSTSGSVAAPPASTPVSFNDPASMIAATSVASRHRTTRAATAHHPALTHRGAHPSRHPHARHGG